jgi:hypothetical protein
MKTIGVASILVVLQVGIALADDNVLCVQRAVTARGYNPGTLDGQLGARTITAAQSAATAARLGLPPLSVGTAGVWCQALQLSPGRVSSTAPAQTAASLSRLKGCTLPHYTVDPDDVCY